MGKSTISMERSTIFHGKIHYFYGKIHHFSWENSLFLWKDPPFFMGKFTISMVIFHSYVKLPEGMLTNIHQYILIIIGNAEILFWGPLSTADFFMQIVWFSGATCLISIGTPHPFHEFYFCAPWSHNISGNLCNRFHGCVWKWGPPKWPVFDEIGDILCSEKPGVDGGSSPRCVTNCELKSQAFLVPWPHCFDPQYPRRFEYLTQIRIMDYS